MKQMFFTKEIQNLKVKQLSLTISTYACQVGPVIYADKIRI